MLNPLTLAPIGKPGEWGKAKIYDGCKRWFTNDGKMSMSFSIGLLKDMKPLKDEYEKKSIPERLAELTNIYYKWFQAGLVMMPPPAVLEHLANQTFEQAYGLPADAMVGI